MVTRVWYIAGTERSGSTLLGDLVAQVTGAFNAGELHLLWQSAAAGRTCTCGKAITSCEVWSATISRVLGSGKWRDISEAAVSERRRPRERECLVRGWATPLHADTAALRRATLEALCAVAGTDRVVDSSKLAAVAVLAASTADDVDIVHLVRDPRAVAYSLSQPKEDPSDHGTLMPQYSSRSAAGKWMVHNLAIERLHRSRPDRVTAPLRYEDLALDPAGTLRRLGLDLPPSVALSGGGHAIAGNPWRFKPAAEISVDLRWTNEMPRIARRTVEVITFPRRARYGYPT